MLNDVYVYWRQKLTPQEIALDIQRERQLYLLSNQNNTFDNSKFQNNQINKEEMAIFTPQIRTLTKLECSEYVFDRPPTDDQFYTTIHLQNGQLKYVYRNDSNLQFNDMKINKISSLLTKSYDELCKEVEQTEINRLVQKQNVTKEREDTIDKKYSVNGQLWVDKYSPKSFSQVFKFEVLIKS